MKWASLTLSCQIVLWFWYSLLVKELWQFAVLSPHDTKLNFRKCARESDLCFRGTFLLCIYQLLFYVPCHIKKNSPKFSDKPQKGPFDENWTTLMFLLIWKYHHRPFVNKSLSINSDEKCFWLWNGPWK